MTDDLTSNLSDAISTMKAQLASTAGDPNAAAADLWMCASLLVGAAECFAEAVAPLMPATSELMTAEAASMPSLLCTGCVIDAKQAVLVGKTPAEIPEPLPATVLIQGMGLCDVRHTVNVGAPSLLVAQPGQIPGRLG